MLPPTQRPLSMDERRNAKRELGRIADQLRKLDNEERRLREVRRMLLAQRDKISAEVYRS